MIGSVASRRANAFAQALDEREPGEATAADQVAGEDARLASPDGEGSGADGGTEESLLLAVADGLSALPRPALDPEVKSAQRARLLAAMEDAFAGGTAGAADEAPGTAADRADRPGRVPGQRAAHSGRGAHRAPPLGGLSRLRPKSRLTKGLAAGGLGVGVAATAFGGVAAASTDALPGDSLYGVKRGMEDLQLDLAGDDADRGQVHLDHASTRLREARRLMERTRSGELDPESLGEVRRTLSGMRYDAAEGHRLLSAAYERDGSLAPMRSLSHFTTGHREAWSRLRDRLPAQLADVGDRVSSVFDAMDSDVRPLRDLIGDQPDDGAPGSRPGGGSGTDEHAPTPGSSSPGDAPSAGQHGRGDESGKPSPSGSESEKGGLLGGGGLLDPPDDGQGIQPSAPKPEGGDKKLPAPDITLPPIVPKVLPGLHGLSEDE